MTAKQLLQLIKSGNVPADYAVGGALTPDIVRNFWTLVVSQNAFLQKVTTVLGKKLTIPLSIYSMDARNLVRVAEGSEPSAGQKADASNVGKTLLLTAVQLFVDLPFQTLEDNEDNPQFENIIANMIAQSFGNDLLDLATLGDEGSGVTFLALNDGWIALAKASSDVHSVNTAGDANITASFDKMLAAHPDKWKNKSTTKWIVSPTDAETYAKYVAGQDASASILMSGNAFSYLGYGVEVNPYQTDGEYLFGNPKELAVGMNLGMKRYRNVHYRKRVVEYTYDLNVDAELIREDALTLAYDQS